MYIYKYIRALTADQSSEHAPHAECRNLRRFLRSLIWFFSHISQHKCSPTRFQMRARARALVQCVSRTLTRKIKVSGKVVWMVCYAPVRLTYTGVWKMCHVPDTCGHTREYCASEPRALCTPRDVARFRVRVLVARSRFSNITQCARCAVPLVRNLKP